MVARIWSEPGGDSPVRPLDGRPDLVGARSDGDSPVRPSRWSPGSAWSREVTHLSVPLDGRPDLLGADDSPVRPSQWSPGSAQSREVTHLSVLSMVARICSEPGGDSPVRPLDGRPDLLRAGG